jgi:hypothetical protein
LNTFPHFKSSIKVALEGRGFRPNLSVNKNKSPLGKS